LPGKKTLPETCGIQGTGAMAQILGNGLKPRILRKMKKKTKKRKIACVEEIRMSSCIRRCKQGDHQSMKKQTNRQFAIHLVNLEVNRLSGGVCCLSDLSDTSNLCAGLDDLEAIIEDSDEFTLMSEIQNIAQGVAYELLEEEGFPFDL
jgi:hypothetical protein